MDYEKSSVYLKQDLYVQRMFYRYEIITASAYITDRPSIEIYDEVS